MIIKFRLLPKLHAWGGTWSASTQEESEDREQFGKARTIRDGGRRMAQGVGQIGSLGEGIALPVLGSPQALSRTGKGQPTTGRIESSTATCSRLVLGQLTKACPSR